MLAGACKEAPWCEFMRSVLLLVIVAVVMVEFGDSEHDQEVSSLIVMPKE